MAKSYYKKKTNKHKKVVKKNNSEAFGNIIIDFDVDSNRFQNKRNILEQKLPIQIDMAVTQNNNTASNIKEKVSSDSPKVTLIDIFDLL